MEDYSLAVMREDIRAWMTPDRRVLCRWIVVYCVFLLVWRTLQYLPWPLIPDWVRDAVLTPPVFFAWGWQCGRWALRKDMEALEAGRLKIVPVDEASESQSEDSEEGSFGWGVFFIVLGVLMFAVNKLLASFWSAMPNGAEGFIVLPLIYSVFGFKAGDWVQRRQFARRGKPVPAEMYD
jgi:hypothetical protein